MLRAGLTGNIGSGKTLVAGIFSKLGIPVFYADPEARKQYDHEEIRQRIRDIFGPAVFKATGEVDKQALAEIVFKDRAKLRQLNDIIHPAVRRDFINWFSQQQAVPYVLYEAAVLFESGYAEELDRIICVTAPEELRISRVMQRDHCSREEVIARMKNQWGEEEKAALSDFVIRNDGSESVIRQVIEVHKRMREMGDGR